MQFRISSLKLSGSWLRKRMARLSRWLPHPIAKPAANSIAPWVDPPSPQSTSQTPSSAGTMPKRTTADEACFLSGYDLLVFDDPWLPSFPKARDRRRMSWPPSPKTRPTTGDGKSRSKGAPVDSKVPSRLASSETVEPGATDLHGRPLTALTLSAIATADLRSFLLRRRWYAKCMTTINRWHANLDTQDCDLIDEMLELEAQHDELLQEQLQPDSPECVYDKQREAEELSEELEQVRKQRQQIIASRKRLDEQAEKATMYQRVEMTRLLDLLDTDLERGGLLPLTSVMPLLLPDGSTQEVPVMLDPLNNKAYNGADEASRRWTLSDSDVCEVDHPNNVTGTFVETFAAWRYKAVASCPEAGEELQPQAAKLLVNQMDEVHKRRVRDEKDLESTMAAVKGK